MSCLMGHLAPTCPACIERGEKFGNVLREGDSAYVHKGLHALVHRNLWAGASWSIDCPGDRADKRDLLPFGPVDAAVQEPA